MASNTIHLNASDVMKQARTEIVIHGMGTAILRIKIATLLIRLAAFVMPFPCNVVVSDGEVD